MIKDDRFINSLMYGDAVKKIAEEHKVGLTEARLILSQMSFKEYITIDEASANITPPSGQMIAPSSAPQKVPQSTNSAQQIKSLWPGKGTPVQVGMTVGLKGPNGLPVPGEISQVDLSSKGVKVKNPTTGQDEWANMDTLEPFTTQTNQSTMQSSSQQLPQQAMEDAEIKRMMELAGIKEDASCGATGAGAIAVAPTSMGTIKRRQPTEEMLNKEYVPKEAAKTIVGDTKPNQASGELSSTLAANKRKTASRRNNGFKR